MENKLSTLIEYLKQLCSVDLDRIISFALGIVTANNGQPDRPVCPHCGGKDVIKYGHKGGKQRFLCHTCNQTFMHTTNTLMENSHYPRSVWADFIRDTIVGVSLDESAEKYKFSHQTAFNMRHKVLLAFQDYLNYNPTILSGITEFDETFVLECYKGKKFPQDAKRKPRLHGAKASSRGISNEQIAICVGIQRDGKAIAATVNRAKPSKEELSLMFADHLNESTLILTDGLRSYSTFDGFKDCSVVDATRTNGSFFNLNTVNGMHSFIKETYNHYRGVATKYINRYNALFSLVYRCADGLASELFARVCDISTYMFKHTIQEVRTRELTIL